MKCPEKVFISPRHNPSDGYVGIAWDKPIPNCESYILKDKLLDLLEELKKERLMGYIFFDELMGMIHSL